jgi:hypothetical protein
VTGGPGIDVIHDPDEVVRADRADLLVALARAGAQVRSAGELIAEAAGPVMERPRAVLVAGPTAAQDSALLVALGGGMATPVVALDPAGSDEAALPTWVGPLDLVVIMAADRDDRRSAELAAQARRRGCGLVVRGALSGPVADAAGSALISPTVGVPEALAGPGRFAVLLGVAAAGGLLPAVDLGAVAGALDVEALACGPAAESFTNPGVGLAQALWGSAAVVLGSEAVGAALATRGAAALRLLGGLPAAGAPAAEAWQAPQLAAPLGTSADPFADPFGDPFADPAQVAAPPVVPVLVAPGPGSGDAARTTHRALQRAFSRCLVVDDGGDDDAMPAQSAGTRAVAAALRVALRLDYAGVYLGIATGQLMPADAPTGLGPAGSAPPSARPATVEGMSGDGAGAERDPWDESTWS